MVQREKLSLTPSSGDVSQSTRDFRGWIGLIVIVPTTATTSYDIKITDDQSVEILHLTGLRGTYRDTTQFLVKGILTFEIENASKDEVFTAEISVEESV